MVEKWSWNGDPDVVPAADQIIASPVVANLNDDNGDGRIDSNDIPDVVFTSWIGWVGEHSTPWQRGNDRMGVLRAVSGADGSRLWPTEEPGYRVHPSLSPTIADVDPTSPGPEVICEFAWLSDDNEESERWLQIVSAEGEVLARLENTNTANHVIGRGSHIAVADMDHDGIPEIATTDTIFHADGTVVSRFLPIGHPVLANIDDDDDLEAIGARGVIDMDGSTIWRSENQRPGFVSVADIDSDGAPEVVVVETGNRVHELSVFRAANGERVWGPIDLNLMGDPNVPSHPQPPETLLSDWPGGVPGGGPPIIANLDDDPAPEIIVNSSFWTVALNADGSTRWAAVLQDGWGRNAPAVFDLNGDGISEVIRVDEQRLSVNDGRDGAALDERCNVSATLYEQPIVVDVNNDGAAELLVVQNEITGETLANIEFPLFAKDGEACIYDPRRNRAALRVFAGADGGWAPTRRIWNQPSYHVTNIDEDGTVPRHELPFWQTPSLNGFRRNQDVESVRAAANVAVDLIATEQSCPNAIELTVRVQNLGSQTADATSVAIFEVSEGRHEVARLTTGRELLPGDEIRLPLRFEAPNPIPQHRYDFIVELGGAADECRIEDNSAQLSFACPDLI